MRVLILLVFSFSAMANEPHDNWTKQELPANSPLRQFPYAGTIADAIFSEPNLRAQPVQHIGVPAQGDFSKQANSMARKIFDHLGVDLKAKTTKKHSVGYLPFTPENHKNAHAVAYEYSSVNERGSSLVTCVVVVKKDQKVHAIFLEGWESAMQSCFLKLKPLTASNILYE